MSNFLSRWLAYGINASPMVRNRIYQDKPDFVVGPPNDPYLKRWWIIPRNRRFNVYLHSFLKSDEDRALHDHPWWSVSLTLQGRMYEISKTPTGEAHRIINCGDIVVRSAEFAHRLEVPPQDRLMLTLFVTGPVVRNWGFHCPKGWMPWPQFTAPGDKGQVGRGCE